MNNIRDTRGGGPSNGDGSAPSHDFISRGGRNIGSTRKTDNDPQRVNVGNSMPAHGDMASGKRDYDQDGDRQGAPQTKRIDIAPKQNLNP